MPAVIPLAIVAAGAVGSAIAGHEAAGAATTGANINAKATGDAAKLQADANAATLKYEQGQADQTQQNFNTTQHANYDQWAARQGRLSAYGQLFGAPAQEIPGYVQPTTLGSMATAPTAGPTPPGGTGSTPSTADPITAQLQANYKALGLTPTGRGTGPTDIAYYADQIKATGGLTDANNKFWFGPGGRIALDAAKAGGGGAASGSPTAAPLTSLGAGLQPLVQPVAGNLTMPTVGSLGSYFSMGAR